MTRPTKQRPHTLHTIIDLGGEELETPVAIDFTFYPGCRGLRGPHGELETPDDPQDLEIIMVRREQDGRDITDLIPDDIMESLTEECWDMALLY